MYSGYPPNPLSMLFWIAQELHALASSQEKKKKTLTGIGEGRRGGFDVV